MREFADHIGISTRTVAKWEGGHVRRVNPANVAALDSSLRLCIDEEKTRFWATFADKCPTCGGMRPPGP